MYKLTRHAAGAWLLLSALLLALVAPGAVAGWPGETSTPVLASSSPVYPGGASPLEPPQATHKVLLDQPISATNPDYWANQDFEASLDHYDVFLADDFANSITWLITKIYVPGATFNDGCPLSCADTLHWQIYRDAGGRPDGDPRGEGNAPVWSTSKVPSHAQVGLIRGADDQPANVTLTLLEPLEFPPGTWWLVFYPTLNAQAHTCQYGRYLSDTTNGPAAHMINPGQGLGFPATWTSIQDPSTWAHDQQDLAFRLEGDTKAADGSATYLPSVLARFGGSPEVSEVVGTDEEALVEHPGGASIFVPRGSVPHDLAGGDGELAFTIRTGSPESFGAPSTPPAGIERFASDIFAMGPEEVTFEEPVRLAMPLYDGLTPGQGQVLMADYMPEEDRWALSGGRVDWEKRVFETDVMHLCINWLALTLPTDRAWGAFTFKPAWTPNQYGYGVCVQQYTLAFPPICPLQFRAVDNYFRVFPGETAPFVLPQGTYTLQVTVYDAATGARLGWYETGPHTLDQPYVHPQNATQEVSLQADNLRPGRAPCMGVPTPPLPPGAINVRLAWNDNADLYLVVLDPCNQFISDDRPEATCQGSTGRHDRDSNCSNMQLGRPENITWAQSPPLGTYQVFVGYRTDCGGAGPVDYTVRWWVDGEVEQRMGTLPGPTLIQVGQFTHQ
jgi:hypothetical protein